MQQTEQYTLETLKAVFRDVNANAGIEHINISEINTKTKCSHIEKLVELFQNGNIRLDLSVIKKADVENQVTQSNEKATQNSKAKKTRADKKNNEVTVNESGVLVFRSLVEEKLEKQKKREEKQALKNSNLVEKKKDLTSGNLDNKSPKVEKTDEKEELVQKKAETKDELKKTGGKTELVQKKAENKDQLKKKQECHSLKELTEFYLKYFIKQKFADNSLRKMIKMTV